MHVVCLHYALVGNFTCLRFAKNNVGVCVVAMVCCCMCDMCACLFILGLHCRFRLDRQDRKVAPKGSVVVNLAAATAAATAGHGAGVVGAGSSNVHKVLSGASASALAAMAMSAAAGRDASSSSDAAMGAQQSPRFSSSSSNAHGAAGGIVVASGGAHVPYTIISAPHRINKFKVPERVHAAWEETETAAAAVERDLTRLNQGNKAAAEAAAAASLSPRPLHQRSPRPDSSSSTRSF